MSAEQQQPDSPAEGTLQEDTNMELPESPPDTSFHNNSSFSDTPFTTPLKTSDPTKINHGAPGSSWATKKFKEEYDRFYDMLVDKNWDTRKYGDPLMK